jgi:transposase-like protein
MGVSGRECPHCGGQHLIKLGFNDRCNPSRRRWLCKDCGKRTLESKLKTGLGICPQCKSKKLRKWGIDRNGTYHRQRYMCENNHLFMEERPGGFPVGRQFYSDPDKLMQAARLMANGRFSLQKIANRVNLDRYTIYKLYRLLGRNFLCGCGRPLHHRGHCIVRWEKSAKCREALDNARMLRRVSKPNAYAWKYAKKKLKELLGIIESKISKENTDA